MVRINKGRQRIAMRKMSRESNLQVTFSKRRFGLFKKASELCTLCGAHVMMIVFSPGGKVFSFGHPNVNDIIYRFSNYDRLFHHNNLQLANTRPDEYIQHLNTELTELVARQEEEKIKKRFLDVLTESKENNKKWYEKEVENLNPNETDYLICILENLKDTLSSEVPHYPQLNHYRNYLGENFGNTTQGFTGDGNHEVSLDVFDQRRMLDLNAFSNTLSYGSSAGSYANGLIVPKNSMN